MKAIVLCAGRGGRLRPLTDDRPKCLLAFGNRTILECCLDKMRSVGISDIVLVTGYKKEMIESLIREKSTDGVVYVHNVDYAGTNTAVSLNLALKVVDDDFILANGDVLFDVEILGDLLRYPHPHCIAVDTDIPLDREEIKVIARDGRVAKIGKELDPKLSLGEAIGLSKVGRGLIPDLIRIYDDLERRGEFHHFFEKGFDRVCAEGGNGRFFGLSATAGRPWVEIDTHEDFDYARREIFPRVCG